MRLDNPIPAVAASLYSACHADLSDIVYEAVDYSDPEVRKMPLSARPKVQARRRPIEHDVEVFAMFAQNWGSTALGLGGMGGAAVTPAYTVVIRKRHTGEFAVYFDGHFAYRVNEPNKRFFADIERRNVTSVKAHEALYLTPDPAPADDGPPKWVVKFGDDRTTEAAVEFEAHDQARAVTRFSAEVARRALDDTIWAAHASISLTGEEEHFGMAWTKVENAEDQIEGLELVRR